MMIQMRLLIGAWVGCLLWAAGCKKAPPPPPPGSMEMFGVTVDLPGLEQEFQNATTEQQAAVQEIKRQCRTWQLVRMLEALDTLSNSPSLSERQTKAVGDVIGQVKQVLIKQAAIAPQTPR